MISPMSRRVYPAHINLQQRAAYDEGAADAVLEMAKEAGLEAETAFLAREKVMNALGVLAVAAANGAPLSADAVQDAAKNR